VRPYVYPALQQSPPAWFKLYGSVCIQAIWFYNSCRYCSAINSVHTVHSPNQFVHVYSFDFSKVFDKAVRDFDEQNSAVGYPGQHLQDYNWINDFFRELSHCTKYAGKCSTVAEVKASVIQGSGIGPAAYTSSRQQTCTQ
jgi:hypothetical protein